jgi:hypothetical protein
LEIETGREIEAPPVSVPLLCLLCLSPYNWKLLISDYESDKLPGGFLPFNVEVSHERAGWSAVTPHDELLQASWFTLSHDLDAPIGTVSYPPAQAELTGALSGGRTKIDPLHSAAHDEMDPFHVLVFYLRFSAGASLPLLRGGLKPCM